MFCPKCGNPTPDGGKFCSACGGTLPNPTETAVIQQSNQPVKPKKKAKWFIFVPVALILVVAIVIGAVALLGGGKETVLVGYEMDMKTQANGYSNSNSWEYEFDDDGNLESYTYVQTNGYEDQESYTSEITLEVEYDEKGRIESIVMDSNGEEVEFVYSYDGDELVEIEYESEEVTYTMEATCEDGLITQLDFESPSGENAIMTFEYDDNGMLTKYHLEVEASEVIKEFDENGRLVYTAQTHNGEQIQEVIYEYDEHDNLIHSSHDYQTYHWEETRDITYDDDGRIESMEISQEMTYKDSDESYSDSYEMEYEWVSDTEAEITYSGDDYDDTTGEIEVDASGNVIASRVYEDGELHQDTSFEFTYMELTKQQRQQIAQISWLVAMYGNPYR